MLQGLIYVLGAALSLAAGLYIIIDRLCKIATDPNWRTLAERYPNSPQYWVVRFADWFLGKLIIKPISLNLPSVANNPPEISSAGWKPLKDMRSFIGADRLVHIAQGFSIFLDVSGSMPKWLSFLGNPKYQANSLLMFFSFIGLLIFLITSQFMPFDAAALLGSFESGVGYAA